MSEDTPVAAGVPERTELLFGWGLTAPSAARVQRPVNDREARAAVRGVPSRGLVARGLGRSYGDAAQNAGGRVVDMNLVGGLEIDATTGIVTAGAGVSIDTLIKVLVPRGWFVPVTPGTRYVTVGGAIAADIHGKNHHVAGTWNQHVRSLRLLVPSGEVLEIGPDADPALFWATAGGLGLTGVVLDATFQCRPIETSRLLVETIRAPDLDAIMDLMRDDDDPYSVAWIDLMATGSSLGRSVLTRGDFARLDQLPRAQQAEPFSYAADILVGAPPLVPGGLLNGLSIRAFNELWFRKAPRHREGELQTIPTFFHPLDMVGRWNRLYGPPGFVQWQIALPFEAEATMRRVIERLSSSGCTSFLAVLKTFGAGNASPLSFPIAGWTLALDIPSGVAGLGPLLDELDVQIADAGGRVYLAKDARLRADLLPAMYPRLDEWRAVRDAIDPGHTLQSDLGRRLGL